MGGPALLKHHEVNEKFMERLDHGHLHPLLEHRETNMSRPGIEPGSPVAGKYSSKELFEQILNIYSEHLYMSLRHGSPSACVI